MLAKTYTLTFTGRLAGAIGIFERHAVKVQAFDPQGALFAAYKTHDHITNIRMTEHRDGMEYAVKPEEYGR